VGGFLLRVFSLPHALMTSRAILGVVFIAAGIGKLLNRRAFVRTVEQYRILPSRSLVWFAKALPLLELSVGISQFSSAAMPWPQLAAACLLTMFAVAIAINLFRGLRGAECGCGLGRRAHLSWRLVFDNVVLIVLAVVSSGVTPLR
jgi:uncharacterized membrane protein YphA (DoxX/SURF4 family)